MKKETPEHCSEVSSVCQDFDLSDHNFPCERSALSVGYGHHVDATVPSACVNVDMLFIGCVVVNHLADKVVNRHAAHVCAFNGENTV